MGGLPDLTPVVSEHGDLNLALSFVTEAFSQSVPVGVAQPTSNDTEYIAQPCDEDPHGPSKYVLQLSFSLQLTPGPTGLVRHASKF